MEIAERSDTVQEWTNSIRDDARENGIQINEVNHRINSIQGALKSSGIWSAYQVISDGNTTHTMKDTARDYLEGVKTLDSAYKSLCNLMEQSINTPIENVIQAKTLWIAARQNSESLYLKDILENYLQQIKDNI